MLIYLNMEFLGDNIGVWSDDIILNLLSLIGNHLEKYHLFPTTIHPSHIHLMTDMSALNKLYVHLKYIEYDIQRTLHILRSLTFKDGCGIVLSFKLMGGRPYVILEAQNNDNEVQTPSLGFVPTARIHLPNSTKFGYQP